MSFDQMRARSFKGVNSLVWLLWHMARTEDSAVNHVVASRSQVLDEARRMNVASRVISESILRDRRPEQMAAQVLQASPICGRHVDVGVQVEPRGVRVPRRRRGHPRRVGIVPHPPHPRPRARAKRDAPPGPRHR